MALVELGRFGFVEASVLVSALLSRRNVPFD